MSQKLKSQQTRLTCTNHGGNTANQVCGDCGDALCADCSDAEYDPLFIHYESDNATKTLLAAAILLIGVPILYPAVHDAVVSPIRARLIGATGLWIVQGVIPGSIFLGLALVTKVWFRTEEGANTRLLVRRGGERILCPDCQHRVSWRSRMNTIVTAVAGLLALYGAYRMVRVMHLEPLKWFGLAGAVYLVKDDIVNILGKYTGTRPDTAESESRSTAEVVHNTPEER